MFLSVNGKNEIIKPSYSATITYYVHPIDGLSCLLRLLQLAQSVLDPNKVDPHYQYVPSIQHLLLWPVTNKYPIRFQYSCCNSNSEYKHQ